MVNQRSLIKGLKAVISSRRLTAYPRPSHAKSALTALVMTRPYVSIIGKITETAIDMKKAQYTLYLILC